jgi:hypothetical protein
MTSWIDENPIYQEYPIAEYQGNPVVEAIKLPPSDDDESITRLSLKPDFREEERNLPPSFRVLLPERLTYFMFPTKQHVKILNRIYSQVLEGYRLRNPLTAEGQRLIHEAGSQRTESPLYHPSKISFLTGLSGMGKSTLIRAIMRSMGKSVIRHSSYQGEPFTESQILYLMRNVPDQSGAKPLCQSFGAYTDKLLQNSLYKKVFANKGTRTEYVAALQSIIANHHVGALVIDEFQNLSFAKSGGKEEVIALILNLREHLGVPIILVGTYPAVDVLREQLSITRRLVEGGFHEIHRPPGPDDEDWCAFCDIVWGYQWLEKPKPMEAKIVEVLYDCSQGITAIMLNLFIAAQIAAIESGTEMIDDDLIKKTYQEQFSPLHGIIDALRSRDPEFLVMYDDLYLKAFDEFITSPAQTRFNELRQKAKTAHEEKMGVFDGSHEKSCSKPKSRKAKKQKPSSEALLDALKGGSDDPDIIFGRDSGG